jgi:signal peptidase II
MSPVARLRILGLGLAALLFAVDQWLKGHVRHTLKLQDLGQIDLIPFFRLTWVENYGVSLGMFTAQSMEMRWGLVAMTALIAVVVAVWLLRERKAWDVIPLALVLGGALGNIRDRVLYGYVVDYADLHIGEFRPFLVFNLADAAITIGVLIILARSFLSREKPPEAEAEPAQPATES